MTLVSVSVERCARVNSHGRLLVSRFLVALYSSRATENSLAGCSGSDITCWGEKGREGSATRMVAIGTSYIYTQLM